jgi:hypothetical protein
MRSPFHAARRAPAPALATLVFAALSAAPLRSEAQEKAPPPAPPAPPAHIAAPAVSPDAPIQVEPQHKKRRSRYITWDANVDGALGYAYEGDGHLSGFGRVRAGVLFVNEEDIQAPAFRAIGLTYDVSDLTPATFGLQFETLSLNSGAWFQAGAMVDIQPRPGFMLAAGLSLIGVEGQVRWSKEEGAFLAVYGKLRVPVGIIAVALSD